MSARTASGEADLVRADAVDIDDRDHASDDDRKLSQSELRKFVGRQRHIRRAEIDRAVPHAQRAGERADRLVVERRTDLRIVETGVEEREIAAQREPALIAVRPSRDHRIGKGRARAAHDLGAAEDFLGAESETRRNDEASAAIVTRTAQGASRPDLAVQCHAGTAPVACRRADGPAVAPPAAASRATPIAARRQCGRSGRRRVRRFRAASGSRRAPPTAVRREPQAAVAQRQNRRVLLGEIGHRRPHPSRPGRWRAWPQPPCRPFR